MTQVGLCACFSQQLLQCAPQHCSRPNQGVRPLPSNCWQNCVVIEVFGFLASLNLLEVFGFRCQPRLSRSVVLALTLRVDRLRPISCYSPGDALFTSTLRMASHQAIVFASGCFPSVAAFKVVSHCLVLCSTLRRPVRGGNVVPRAYTLNGPSQYGW